MPFARTTPGAGRLDSRTVTARATSERRRLGSLNEALDARGYGPADKALLTRVVDHLVSKLGAVHEVSIAQSGNAIDVSCGNDTGVALFIHRGYADVPPRPLAQLGGLAQLVDACPGFVAGPGNRSNHARIALSGQPASR